MNTTQQIAESPDMNVKKAFANLNRALKFKNEQIIVKQLKVVDQVVKLNKTQITFSQKPKIQLKKFNLKV